jgi:hypothetical protein
MYSHGKWFEGNACTEFNGVRVKGVVEYFDKILLQNKIKGVESDFLGSHNFQLRYQIGERVQSLEK